MKFLFDDESFSFETLRAAGFALYGGADLGEVLVTAAAITGGDEASWHGAWKATAERLRLTGEQALAAGHRVSAREALLRASNYYRAAEFFLRENPATDPEVTLMSARSRETFMAAASLLDTPAETVAIPYAGTTSWPTTVPARAPRCASRNLSSAPTGKPSSGPSSTTP
jgi:hypothetical protein